MAYISYNQKEDAQDDVLRILAGFVLKAEEAHDDLDAKKLWRACKFIYCTFQARLDKEHRERCAELIEETQSLLWGIGRANDQVAMSDALNRVMELYTSLCEYFNVKGLLMRLEADLDSIVARRSQ